VRLGVRSLWLHRLRSLLTVLGIVFGVCSVIAMLAIGEGASFEAQEQIKNLGSQNIIVRSAKPPEEQKVSDRGSQNYVLDYGLTYRDVNRFRLTIPGVSIVLPSRNIREYAWNISRRVDCEVVGTVPFYPEMRNHRVATGRFFTDTEMDAKASVCVLGAEMVPALFPLESPLGKQVRVGGNYYQVIGVMEARGQTLKSEEREEASAKPASHRMFIPLETAKLRYGEVLMRRRHGSGRSSTTRVEFGEMELRFPVNPSPTP
jgi:putative ABC transport system permease protein